MVKYLKEPGNCADCGHKLTISKQREKYTYYVCAPCRHKEYPTTKVSARKRNFKSRGVSEEWYEQTLKSQDGVCAICKQPPTEKRRGVSILFNIDHDHNCCASGCANCVRGLLCSNCNRGIGKFHDDVSKLESAILYLKMYVADLPESV